MRLITALFLLMCTGVVSAGEKENFDSCLTNIPKAMGLNIALDDSLSGVLNKYKLTKSKNVFGHIYWSGTLKIQNVSLYLQCFFEKSKLIDIFVSRNFDKPCIDSAGVSKEITILNGALNSCLHKTFEMSDGNGFAATFDTVTSKYRIFYSYVSSTLKLKQCGFKIEIENILTDHYKKREEEVGKIINGIK
jgi:hypothetical protein